MEGRYERADKRAAWAASWSCSGGRWGQTPAAQAFFRPGFSDVHVWSGGRRVLCGILVGQIARHPGGASMQVRRFARPRLMMPALAIPVLLALLALPATAQSGRLYEQRNL